MVRLLLATVGRVGYDDVKFQSHNGAIAAALPLNRFVRYEGFNPTMVRLLQCCQNCAKIGKTWFQSHNGAIAAKAKFWGLRSKGKEMVRGLQSTFGCLKTLRGSTATEPSKLGYFGLKLPPLLYLAFKVLKTA